MLKNAENYYRTMVGGGSESWNLRDRHMTETLERLMELPYYMTPLVGALAWAVHEIPSSGDRSTRPLVRIRARSSPT